MTLTEALEQVELEPGATYRCRVRGMSIELQVHASQQLPTSTRPDELRECDLTPSDDWFELPGPKPVAQLKPTHKADFSPIILDLTDDQLKPE